MRTIAIITKDVRKYWWLVAGGLTAIFVLEMLALYSPQLIKKAIDRLAAGQADPHGLGLIAGAIVALSLGVAVLRAVGRPSMLAFGRIVERDLRRHFFARVIALPRSAIDKQPAGDIMARATYDIDNIRLAAGYGCQAAINSILTLILALVYMIWMSPVLTLLAMVPMGAIPWLTRRQSIRFHQCHKSIQESFSALTEESRDSLNAIRLIKVFDLTAVKDRQFDRLAQTHLDNNMQLARVSALYLPVMTLVTHLSQAVVWGCGGAMAVLGMLTAGEIVAFSAYLVMLKTPLVYSGYLINLYQRAKSSCTRVDRILNQFIEALDKSSPGQVVPCQDKDTDIVIKNLTFTYPGESRPVLTNISLRFPHGTTTALVGPVGSGKSTLLQLLTRIHEPPQGTIFIGHTDITQMPLHRLRSTIAMAAQAPFVFSDTIRENLLLAFPQASDDQLWQAIEAAGLTPEIRALSQKLDSLLGEKGQTLSGGQRARLCLARTILPSRSMLLLDDPLSSVDTKAEARILEQLSHLRKGLTNLIVSHRPLSLSFCDHIVVLDGGCLEAQGNHDDLIKTCRLYRQLVLSQQIAAKLNPTAAMSG
ncbi:putative ABC transporter, ATP-binding/permease protein [Desulfosarcina variabilis str. Montpellier]|uniref:ABC transporter ATP-binding protein n=1 Tax=Desulfosarcina variabilis TaxID=2300 RepID=UPI003AFA6E39